MPEMEPEAGVPQPTGDALSLPAGVTVDGDLVKAGDNMHFDEFMKLNLAWLSGTVSFYTKKLKWQKRIKVR